MTSDRIAQNYVQHSALVRNTPFKRLEDCNYLDAISILIPGANFSCTFKGDYLVPHSLQSMGIYLPKCIVVATATILAQPDCRVELPP